MTTNQAARQFRAKLINKGCQGGAFALGVAAIELLGAVAAPAATATVAVVEASIIVPAVLTTAAVGGTIYGAYKVYEHVSK